MLQKALQAPLAPISDREYPPGPTRLGITTVELEDEQEKKRRDIAGVRMCDSFVPYMTSERII